MWGMLNADDAGIVSRSPEGLEKMMTVIVTACLGLTISEAKTKIMCLQTKGGGHVPFTVTAAGQVYKQGSRDATVRVCHVESEQG